VHVPDLDHSQERGSSSGRSGVAAAGVVSAMSEEDSSQTGDSRLNGEEADKSDSAEGKPKAPGVRSILKKANSDHSILKTSGFKPDIPRRSSDTSTRNNNTKKVLTFSDSVTTYYGIRGAVQEGVEPLDSGDDSDEEEAWQTKYNESSPPLPDEEEAVTTGRSTTGSRITSVMKNKVSNIWKKPSSRTKIQSEAPPTPKFGVGQTSISVKKRRQREYLTASCSSVEGLQQSPPAAASNNVVVGPSEESPGKPHRSHSLPRGASFDSADLLSTSSSHGWKSRLKHFRKKRSLASTEERESGGAVLTKVTSLGRKREGLWGGGGGRSHLMRW